jgi:hypothetical protein
LQHAYAAAADGDHIDLASATYAGTFTFGRTFSTTAPVVIKARSLNGAVFSGQMTVSGVGHWLYQIKSTFNGTARSGGVVATGDYFWATRCWFAGRDGLSLLNFPHHVWVGWSRFTGKCAQAFGAFSHLYMQIPDNWPNINSGPHDIYIYRNFFFDNTSPAPTQDQSPENHVIYFGESKAQPDDLGVISECYVEYNKIYHDGTGRSRTRGIYLKRGCVMRYNDVSIPDGAGNNGFRHSRGGEIYGNTIRDDSMEVNGGTLTEHALVYGNAVGQNLLLKAGSQNNNGGVLTQAADYAVLAGNRAYPSGTLQITLGSHGINIDNSALGGGKIDHVTIYSGGFAHSINSQGATWVDTATCDLTARAGWGPFTPVTPIILANDEVGQELADQR